MNINPAIKSKLFLILKIIFIISAFYYLFNNIEIDTVEKYFYDIDPLLFIISAIFLIISQIFSSLRFQYYLKSNNVIISKIKAIKLYFIGIFFNIFLPGGIGGDFYRLWEVSKNHDIKKIRSLQVILSERANGLYILIMSLLVIFFALCLYYINTENINMNLKQNFYFYGSFFSALLITNIGYYVGLKYILHESIKVAIGALYHSSIIQLFSLLSGASLIISITINYYGGIPLESVVIYLIIFIISSIIAVLPITIGGIGLRELTFYFFGNLGIIETEQGVAFALLFFILNIITAAIGGIFYLRQA